MAQTPAAARAQAIARAALGRVNIAPTAPSNMESVAQLRRHQPLTKHQKYNIWRNHVERVRKDHLVDHLGKPAAFYGGTGAYIDYADAVLANYAPPDSASRPPIWTREGRKDYINQLINFMTSAYHARESATELMLRRSRFRAAAMNIYMNFMTAFAMRKTQDLEAHATFPMIWKLGQKMQKNHPRHDWRFIRELSSPKFISIRTASHDEKFPNAPRVTQVVLRLHTKQGIKLLDPHKKGDLEREFEAVEFVVFEKLLDGAEYGWRIAAFLDKPMIDAERIKTHELIKKNEQELVERN